MAQATATINLQANTQDAEASVSRLENNIKTLDGAINLVGGTIETLAGTLAITGAVTEEQAERFQTAAVGAIALADGSKRALEGFKILATETDLAAKAQRAFNIVMRANPLGLIVTALGFAATAFVAFKVTQQESRDATERLNDELDEQLNLLKGISREYLGGADRLANFRANAEALNITVDEQIKREKERVEDAIAGYKEEIQAVKDAIASKRQDAEVGEKQIERLQTLLDEGEKYYQSVIAGEAQLAKERQEAADEAEKNRKETTQFQEETIQLKKKEIDFEVDYQGQVLKSADVQRQTELQKTEVARVQAEQRKKIAEAEEAAKQALLTDGIDNIQGALTALFGENKAVASANVLIDAAQAGVGIIKNSQTTGPFAIAYQATQFALLAATTIAALRDINSAQPGGGGTPSTPRGGGVPTSGGFGTQTAGTGGIPQIPGFGTSGVTTLNAVVLAGDVTSAQAQDAAIRNRRRFG